MAMKYASADPVILTNAAFSNRSSAFAIAGESCRVPADAPTRYRAFGKVEHVFPAITDQQQAAVDHAGGHLLIVAGAGTGKTTTLASRLAALVARGVAPERVLLLTFSRRAAAELL